MGTQTFDVKTLVNLTRAIVRAESSKESRCAKLAEYIVGFHNAGNDFKTEYTRLTKEAKKVADNAGAICDRNTWQSVNNYIAQGMAPTALIETESGTGDKKKTEIVNAEDCTTAKDVRAAGKQIRDMYDLGRAPKVPAETTNVSKGAVQTATDVAATILDLLKDDANRAATVKLLKENGIRLTVTKAAAVEFQPKTKKVA